MDVWNKEIYISSFLAKEAPSLQINNLASVQENKDAFLVRLSGMGPAILAALEAGVGGFPSGGQLWLQNSGNQPGKCSEIRFLTKSQHWAGGTA